LKQKIENIIFQSFAIVYEFWPSREPLLTISNNYTDNVMNFSEFVVYFIHGPRGSSLKTWARTRLFKLVTNLRQTIESSC